MRVIGVNRSEKELTKIFWRHKSGGDPVSFEYGSYHRSKVELFSALFPTNRVQVIIVVC